MEKDEIPIADNELSSELIGLGKEPISQRKKLIALTIGITVALVLIIIIIIIITSVRDNNTNENEEKGKDTDDDKERESTEILAEINCYYDVQSNLRETNILSNNFRKEQFDFDIYINNEKIKYSQTYQFPKIGLNTVKYVIYEKMNMDNMFRDVVDLYSVNMASEKNCEITSMISTFENCQRLISFNFEGFNTTQLTSMQKLFYKTSLSEISLNNFYTKNVKDMSYMLASTEISKIDLSLIDTSNVEDMSHICSNIVIF